MRRWIYRFSFVLTLLQGCATSDALKTASVGERNVDNLARLNLGMSETQVLGIMHAPYKEENFQVQENQYDVWFYVTEITVLGQTRMVPLNLTPLTFKNQVLIGTGYSYYHWLKEQAKNQKSRPLDRVPSEPFSMSSPPKTEEEAEEAPSSKAPKKKGPPPEDKDVQIDDKDKQMLEDESDQNFNFW